MKCDIGVIGGSGFYSFLKNVEEISLKTPYGKTSDKIAIGKFKGKKIAFIPRHGKEHKYSPHMIPYKANMYAMKQLGVKYIIAPTACGSLNKKFKLGDFVITNQFINQTWRRDDTFQTDKVEHLPMAEPYCKELRDLAYTIGEKMKLSIHSQGTVVVIEGPRFSTKAESEFYEQIGGDIINMTQYPECYLAAELGMNYLNIGIVTDYDAGIKGNPEIAPVTYEQVQSVFKENINKLQELVCKIIEHL